MDALKGEVGTIAQVNSLQNTSLDRSTGAHLLWFRQCQYAAVCDGCALHQTYSLQFRKRGQLCDGSISEVCATSQIDVSDPVAQLHQLRNTSIGDARTVAKMDVVQVLAQASNGHHRPVCDVATLGENQVAQSRCGGHNSLNAVILKLTAICQVQNAQTLVRCLGRKTKEGLVRDFPAVG